MEDAKENKKSKGRALKNIAILIITFVLIASIVMFFIQTILNLYCTINKLNFSLMSKSFYFTSINIIIGNAMRIFVVLFLLKGSLKDKLYELKLSLSNANSKLFIIGIILGFTGIFIITVLGIGSGITKFNSISSYVVSIFVTNMLLSLILFLFVGVGEEIMFRGYIVNELLKSGSKFWVLTISSLIFMLAHVGTYFCFLDFVDVFLAGVLLGYLYITFDSLWLPIGFHFMWDFTQSFIINIEGGRYSSIAILKFKIPKDIYFYGIDLGCKFEVIFILVVLVLISLIYLIEIKRDNSHSQMID